jgi:hypothetical protein
MNTIQLVFRGFKTILLAMAMFGQGSVAFAKVEGCWAEFFEVSQYQGKHFRVEGPAQLARLNNINGENWDSRIDSLKVGPNAKVTVYKNSNFTLSSADMAEHPDLMNSMGVTEKDIKEDSELIFIPDDMIHDLSDFQFHHKIRSLKVECI